MTFHYKPFSELTPHELYQILRLRAEVFVVEQNCVFLDQDEKDYHCGHLMGWQEEHLVAYTRIIPAGISYAEASIGRVVTSPQARKGGFGKALMQESIQRVYSEFGQVPIRIGAQLYLQQFYESFGFQQDSEVYVEDGIEHIEMILNPVFR